MQLRFPNSLVWNINHNYVTKILSQSVRLCRQIDKSAAAKYSTLFSQRTFNPLQVTAPEGTTETGNFSQSENFFEYVTC